MSIIVFHGVVMHKDIVKSTMMKIMIIILMAVVKKTRCGKRWTKRHTYTHTNEWMKHHINKCWSHTAEHYPKYFINIENGFERFFVLHKIMMAWLKNNVALLSVNLCRCYMINHQSLIMGNCTRN